MATSQTGKTRSTTRKAPPAAPKSPHPPVKAAPAKKKAPVRKPAPTLPTMNSPEWKQLIATAAYLRAEARGFIGGSSEEDWFEAEAEIMAKLGSGKAIK
jgi:Protein of unknown function (DUF2934)